MRYYVKIGNNYYEYSTVCDCVGEPMTLEELSDHMTAKGWSLEDQEQTLAELDTRGTNSVYDTTVQAAVSCNYQGLTWDEFLEHYG